METIYLFSVIILCVAVAMKSLVSLQAISTVDNVTAQKNFNIMVARVNERVNKGFCSDEMSKKIKEELVNILNSKELNPTQKANQLKGMEEKYPEVLDLKLFI